MTVNPRPVLDQLLDSRDDTDIMAAARELAPRTDLASETARLLVDLLNAGTDSRAAAAAFILCEWGHHALDASPALLTTLRRQTAHSNVTVRHWCVAALRRLGDRASVAIPELSVCLRDEDDGVRTLSLHTLAQFGPEAAVVLPCVLDAVYDNNDEVRQAALAALVLIDPQGKTSLEELCLGLASESARTRQSALDALSKLGDIARPAAKAVYACIHDQNSSVRVKAVRTLQSILPPEPALLHALGLALHDEEEEVRMEALRGFACFTHSAAHAAPYVISALRDPSAFVRFHALEVLESITPHLGLLIAAARIAVENCLRDASPLVQTRAVQACGRIEEWTRPVAAQTISAHLSEIRTAGPALPATSIETRAEAV